MASDPAPSSIGNLPGFKFDMGHQEAERIVDELEQICRTVRNSAGDAWMLVASAQNMICTDLGYEDEGELEDALKGTFDEFMKALPHIETKVQDDGSASQGRLVFRMRPLPPLEERKMFVKKLHIKSRQDLWRVVHKAPSALVEIPEIEFEIGADAKRKIDSVYNHVSQHGMQIPNDHKEKIAVVIDQLNKLLDVEEPWTFMIHDRTGLSDIQPEEGVETVFAGPAMEDPIEAQEREDHEQLMQAIAEAESEKEDDSEESGNKAQDKLTMLDVD